MQNKVTKGAHALAEPENVSPRENIHEGDDILKPSLIPQKLPERS